MSSFYTVENSYATKLQQRGLSVQRGFLDDDIARSLHEGSKDPAIRMYTRDATRFATPDAVYEWNEASDSPRVFYKLVGLAISGVVWFTPDTSEHTPALTGFSIRLFEDSRDRGLSGDFIEATHNDFVTTQGGDDTWLRVHPDHQVARGLYQRHGYELDHHGDDWDIMTRKAS